MYLAYLVYYSTHSNFRECTTCARVWILMCSSRRWLTFVAFCLGLLHIFILGFPEASKEPSHFAIGFKAPNSTSNVAQLQTPGMRWLVTKIQRSKKNAVAAVAAGAQLIFKRCCIRPHQAYKILLGRFFSMNSAWRHIRRHIFIYFSPFDVYHDFVKRWPILFLFWECQWRLHTNLFRLLSQGAPVEDGKLQMGVDSIR